MTVRRNENTSSPSPDVPTSGENIQRRGTNLARTAIGPAVVQLLIDIEECRWEDFLRAPTPETKLAPAWRFIRQNFQATEDFPGTHVVFEEHYAPVASYIRANDPDSALFPGRWRTDEPDNF